MHMCAYTHTHFKQTNMQANKLESLGTIVGLSSEERMRLVCTFLSFTLGEGKGLLGR